jgi:23S rRNA (uracil1939-C5)-methyltransferase
MSNPSPSALSPQFSPSSEITIDRMAHGGYGVGRKNGMVCFVPFAAKQDNLEIQITKQKKSFAFAQIHSIKMPSPHRTEPFCPHYGTCGGCQFQHVAYSTEIEYKKEILTDMLGQALDQRNLPPVHPVAADGQTHLGYRPKATFHFASNGEFSLGFYGRKSKEIISLTECQILHPLLQRVIGHDLFRDLGKELRRHFPAAMEVVFRKFDTGLHCHVLLAANRQIPKPQTHSVEHIAQILSTLGIHSVSISHEDHVSQQGKTKIPQVVWGKNFFETKIGGWTYRVPPTGFFQNHISQVEKLLTGIREFVGSSTRRVLDAYCGAGFLSLPLAKQCDSILGFDSDFLSIECAAANARMNGVLNAKYMNLNGESVFRNKHIIAFSPDTVILDPPRSGANPSLLQYLNSRKTQKVIYVSCSPATLARDLKILQKTGYRLQRVTMIDMFPHTYHIESVSLLSQ